MYKKITLENSLSFLLKALLFLLPWQTIWIYKEQFLNGVKWEYGTLGFYVSEILLWAAVLIFMAWFVKKLAAKDLRFKINFGWSKDRIFALACLIFVIYVLASIFWAADVNLGLQWALRIVGGIVLFFMLYIGPLTFRQMAVSFVGGAVLQSILGVWQFLSQSTFAFKWLGLVSHPVWQAGTSVISGPEVGRWLRAYGAFPHPNILGGYLVISLMVSYLLFLKTKRRSWQTRLLQLFIIGIQVMALFFTFSRSTWLAFIFVLVILFCFAYFWDRQKKRLFFLGSNFLVTIGLFLVLSFLLWPLIQTRLAGESVTEVRSTVERVQSYEESKQLFGEHPWLGVGAGNYTIALYKMNPTRPGWEYQPVHNMAMLLLVDLGIIGLLLLAVVGVIFFIYQFEIPHFYLFCYFLHGVIYIVLAMFDHYLLSSYTGILLTAVYWAAVLRFLPHTLHK